MGLAVRSLAVVLTLGAADYLVWRVACGSLPDLMTAMGAWQTMSPGQLLVPMAWVLLVAAVGMLTVSTLLTVAGELTSERFPLLQCAARWSAPFTWRRMVLSVCGLGVVSPLAVSPALAHDTQHEVDCRHGCAAAEQPHDSLDGLPMPVLPASPPAAEPPAEPRPRIVVVARGDCLWSIARQLLPPKASNRDVSEEAAALYAANRAVIGPDPDLIFPGTRLVAPKGRS